MKNLKVVKIESEKITFDDGTTLYSYHDQDCCEYHYLSFNDLDLRDFEDLTFDLTNDNFFNKIEGYGIELIPIKGFSIKVPGYGSNNGYYSTNLTLCVTSNGKTREYDIEECQEIND